MRCDASLFSNGARRRGDQREVVVPVAGGVGDNALRTAELCDALVALGCAEKPSEVLLAMSRITVKETNGRR
jgi:hypothetical protein